MLAIIGGTGLTKLENLIIKRREIVRTVYGDPSQPLIFGEVNGKEVVFLARHGSGHSIPPHAVNYRANVAALQQVGVTHIASVATVGGIHADLAAGVIAVPDQIIDYTFGRQNTYFDGDENPVKHIDFTQPFCESLRKQWILAANKADVSIVNHGIYAVMQGPRLETAAEINRLEKDGATMVGMTVMPEAALARELDIRYAAICPVANFAAGRGDSAIGISFDVLVKNLESTMMHVRNIIEHLVESYEA
jgi:5'-methylthioinosine phosphorylase